MKNKKKTSVLIIIFSLVILAIIYSCYKLLPLLFSLNNPSNIESFKQKIQSLKFTGWIIVLIMQILQIFIAFIPGEIIEILSGILYGTVGGLLICLTGIIIGSILIYYTVKIFASKHMKKYKEKLKTYSFLNSPQKIHLYFFVLFLIPGIPKDIFIYLVPFLPIKLSTFILVSTFARIPSILSSTIIGNSLINGNYTTSIIIFFSFALIGITSILFHDKILSLLKKHHTKQLNNKDTIEN